MKECRVCRMIVDADGECPICGSTVTYEPEIERKRPKYRCNRYLWGYLLRNYWFPAILAAYNLYVILRHRPEASDFFLYALTMMFISLYTSVRHGTMRERLLRRTGEESEWTVLYLGVLKYICGGASAVMLTLIVYL